MFKPNLAEPIQELADCRKPEDRILRFPRYLSPKLDGIRLCTVEDTVLTRSRKEPANKYTLARLQPFQGLDGEVIIGDPREGEEVYRRTQSAINTISGQPDFTFYVFDDLSDLLLPFDERLESLKRRQALFPDWIVVLEQVLVHTQEEYDEYAARNLELGYEGTMSRNTRARYKFGRSTLISQDLLKDKPFADDEAPIVGFYEAMENTNAAQTNELGRTFRSTHAAGLVPKGTLGGFILDKGNGPFRCGAGAFKHKERQDIWENRWKHIGKWITYRHMPYGAKVETGLPRMARARGFRSVDDMG